MQDIRYPIGRFNPVANPNEEQIKGFVDQLEKQPILARQAFEGLTEERIDTPYRPKGWTLRQVIHHNTDAHINAYVRFKLAITEDKPTVNASI